jgi:hypothetical protein
MLMMRTRRLHPMPGLAWTQLRDDVVALVRHGWPLLPGTYQVDDEEEWFGKPHAADLEPVADLWTMAATTDPTVAANWWTQRPYSVLLSCGITIDAFEIAKDFADEGMERLRDVPGPVAVTPFGALLVFAHRSAVDADRALWPEVQWHREGKWVPLPPTTRVRLRPETDGPAIEGKWVPLPPTTREGIPYRWRREPHTLGWRLPSAFRVFRALSHAVSDCP